MTARQSTGSQILSPVGWARAIGYANGVVASGRHIVLAGQIGWNPATATIESDDFVGQVRQTLQNIVTLLREAGAEPRHLVRLTWFVTDKRAYLAARRDMGAVYRDVIGAHYPAMSVVFVSELLEDRAQVEIEATAVVPT